ncbi:reverse transcriptase family protein [Rhizobiaceae bacterium n13]|uniref:reverse transcriptase family protein n=1 Tax=Ferirhizobium litorale TaxID=2927786 RepID=UPI0024B2D7E9|nr:reverse transcriptase family protein [Fererhizobium litorale]MDI7865335.1 reverse transcriptase family protein [Fererhizobium litorale]
MTTFALHTYLDVLKKEHAPAGYIEAVRRHAKILDDKKLPVLLTLGQLAFVTDVNYPFMHAVVKRKVDPYKVFSITKRSGGKRFIVVANANLGVVQRWIHENILTSAAAIRTVSEAATAYLPGSSHATNASRHQNASWIVKVDITRFFESISERQVYYVFRSLGYRALLAFQLARICTRTIFQNDHRAYRKRWVGSVATKNNILAIGHLPQGAATSPMLANLVCRQLDGALTDIASDFGLTFTRYADDITMSGDLRDRIEAGKVVKRIAIALGKQGFNVNHQKTRVAKNGGRKIVTGISVEGDLPRVPRDYKDRVRQQLYYIERFGLKNHCGRTNERNQLSYLLRLSGQIKYIKSVEPLAGEQFAKQLKQLVPELEAIEQLAAVASERP